MPQQLVQLLLNGIRLKQTPRTGWVQRGVPNAENVAAHSYGVTLAALALVEAIEQPFDVAKVLAMAVLHDLPEVITSDIPSPVKRLFPTNSADLKTTIERSALREMTADLPFGEQWRALWEELMAEESAESRLVHDADKIDLYLQAYTYEQQLGNQQLDQFWQKQPTFHFSISQQIYDHLQSMRR